jgi:hypothetical protein
MHLRERAQQTHRNWNRTASIRPRDACGVSDTMALLRLVCRTVRRRYQSRYEEVEEAKFSIMKGQLESLNRDVRCVLKALVTNFSRT